MNTLIKLITGLILAMLANFAIAKERNNMIPKNKDIKSEDYRTNNYRAIHLTTCK